VDPLSNQFPWNSVYCYAEGDPVNYIDLDGGEKPLLKAQAVPIAKRPIIEPVHSEAPPLALQQAKQRAMSISSILTPEQKKAADQAAIIKQLQSNQATLKQGGVLGSDEYKIVKGRVELAYTISQYTPVTGDLHDIKDVATNISKGDFASAGISAIFLIPGTDVLKPIKSLVKADKQLLKFAKETFDGSKAFSKEATDLVDIYRKGGNPGKGTKDIGDGIMELRGANTRVYFREGKEGMEILGYSTKNNQQKVIDRIKNVYGKK
jgi:putative component of toxin-antitoxin plasmid stabilization module